MQTAIIDYESGNLHSARKAFERIAAETNTGSVTVTSDPDVVARADRIVLPGDGAFPACRDALLASDVYAAMIEAVVARARPFLGICVGMQLMAMRGEEYRETPGLSWINGSVQRIKPQGSNFKIPHMGWNNLVLDAPHPLLNGIETGDHAYFVHSYQMEMGDPEQRLAYVDYGSEITAIVGQGTMVGTQFHPEKSAATGLKLIANFLRWTP